MRFLACAALIALLPLMASARSAISDDAQPQDVPARSLLLRIDPKTGKDHELLRVDHQSLGAPVLVGDRVYVADSDKTLHALDAKTGAEKWAFKGEKSLFGLAATDKSVFVGVGGALVAIDAHSGKPLWTFDNQSAVTDPVLTDGAIVFNSFDGLTAIEQQTGKLRWRLDIQWGYFVLSPLTDRRLCVWKPDEIYMVDTERGKTLWHSFADEKNTAPGALPSPAVGDRDTLFQLRGSKRDAQDWSLHALDAASGNTLWKTPLAIHDGAAARTIVRGDAVYCLLDGSITAMRVENGNKLWYAPVKPIDLSQAIPLVAAGLVLIPQADGTLEALDARSGEQHWTHAAKLSSPAANSRFGGIAAGADSIYVTQIEVAGKPQ